MEEMDCTCQQAADLAQSSGEGLKLHTQFGVNAETRPVFLPLSAVLSALHIINAFVRFLNLYK
jgi:hypothetical protein